MLLQRRTADSSHLMGSMDTLKRHLEEGEAPTEGKRKSAREKKKHMKSSASKLLSILHRKYVIMERVCISKSYQVTDMQQRRRGHSRQVSQFIEAERKRSRGPMGKQIVPASSKPEAHRHTNESRVN